MGCIESKPKLEKNLATCKPTEALAQMGKIRKIMEKWLTDIELSTLFEEVPDIVKTGPDATDEEKANAYKQNYGILLKTLKTRGLALFDKAIIEYPEETLSVLALACFVEPEHVDDYTLSEYIEALNDMRNDKAASGFFTLLTAAVRTIFLIASKR